jgi:hypothetical protein
MPYRPPCRRGRLQWPHRGRPRPALELAVEHQRRCLINRDRPLPAGTRPDQFNGHYPALECYAILRLLLGHRAVVLSFSDLPAHHRTGTQQISRDKTLRFRCDHVANTPLGPTGIGLCCREQAHPPKERLTALHSRSPPQRTYGFLQARPDGSSAALNQAALEPPGELRAAPLPLRCWVPPDRPQVRTSTSDLTRHALRTRLGPPGLTSVEPRARQPLRATDLGNSHDQF